MIVQMFDYRVMNSGSVEVHFISADPAPYAHSDFFVTISAVEADVNQQQLRTVLTDRLQQKYGSAISLPDGSVVGQGIASLNTFKGQTITVTT